MPITVVSHCRYIGTHGHLNTASNFRPYAYMDAYSVVGTCPGDYGELTCRMSADKPSIVEHLDRVSLHAMLTMDDVPSAVALLHSM